MLAAGEPENKAASERCRRSSLSHLATLNSRRRIREEQANRLAVGVIPRSGGADLWKHRALNRGRNQEREERGKKKGRTFKKIKKNHGTLKEDGRRASAAGRCAIRTSAAIKGIRREDALSSGTSGSLIAEGKREGSSRGGSRWSFHREKALGLVSRNPI